MGTTSSISGEGLTLESVLQLDNSVSVIAKPEELQNEQPHSLPPSTPIVQEESVSSIQQQIDPAQEALTDHPAYQHFLQYIEARQQVLLFNIACCDEMLEQLEHLLTVSEPSPAEAMKQCDN
ncbi:hypothetical protein chiPu_0012831 [Chiloscyllium punctatum]|uniref:Uncharacterized protein n=1 Tax=Chiloscyllium punctatum TaxID=137246 RepID=A0A401SVF1_CHIPU|nr:hypothetical protein [Chiloscyllium punctatum]